MSISTRGFESADLPTSSAKAATAGDFASFDLKSLSVDDMASPSKTALPNVSISESPAIEPQTIEPYFLNIGEVKVTTASQNEAAGVEPDFIIGEDGQIRKNPNKAVIAQDGNLNIQVEGGGSAEAIKAANEAQKATVRELIRYYQKYNPGKPVPQEWTDKLHAEPNLPAADSSRANTSSPRASVAPDYDPGNSSPGNSTPSYRSSASAPRNYSATPFSPGGRSSSPGYRSASPGYDSGNYPAEPIGPRGNIENFAPVAGDLAMKGPPTITAEKIDEVLKSYGSPAAGLGQLIYDEGVRTGINPAIALGFFIQESSAGTAGVARHTKSFGNIKGEGPAGSYKGFRAYPTWEDGIKDWYRLIDDKYLAPQSEGGRGHTHLSQVLNTYAPKSENDTTAYIANVKGMVNGWDNGSNTAVA